MALTFGEQILPNKCAAVANFIKNGGGRLGLGHNCRVCESTLRDQRELVECIQGVQCAKQWFGGEQAASMQKNLGHLLYRVWLERHRTNTEFEHKSLRILQSKEADLVLCNKHYYAEEIQMPLQHRCSFRDKPQYRQLEGVWK